MSSFHKQKQQKDKVYKMQKEKKTWKDKKKKTTEPDLVDAKDIKIFRLGI